MLSYNTSLRSRTAEETILIAKKYAIQYGITRVTNTTLLDTIGVPVYASIRPDADLSSLCVCAGKGILPMEAEAGAFMEALEFALSEQRYSNAALSYRPVRAMLDGALREEAILDFCPKMGFEIDLDEQIPSTEAFDLITGQSYYVPAELVFMPFHNERSKSFFGSHTNGLASGNTANEASLHGILEVVERDIISFQSIKRTAIRLDPDSYPTKAKEVAHKIQNAGIELIVNYVDNEWELPFFSATLMDLNTQNPMYINGGYGCHFKKSIALMRAITESIQSRMTFIHGGRDDVIDDYLQFADLSELEKVETFKKNAKIFRAYSEKISFDHIVEPKWQLSTVDEYLDQLLAHLVNKGIRFVLRVSHTHPKEALQVVKTIIPKMEFFTPINARVGKRLRDYAQNIAHNIVRRA